MKDLRLGGLQKYSQSEPNPYVSLFSGFDLKAVRVACHCHTARISKHTLTLYQFSIPDLTFPKRWLWCCRWGTTSSASRHGTLPYEKGPFCSCFLYTGNLWGSCHRCSHKDSPKHWCQLVYILLSISYTPVLSWNHKDLLWPHLQ